MPPAECGGVAGGVVPKGLGTWLDVMMGGAEDGPAVDVGCALERPSRVSSRVEGLRLGRGGCFFLLELLELASNLPT